MPPTLISVLGSAGPTDGSMSPDARRDLGLDRVLDVLQLEGDLARAFVTPLPDEDAVRFRQDVFRDLERESTRVALTALADAVQRAVQQRDAAARIRQHPLRHRLHLNSVLAYLQALDAAVEHLEGVRSEALLQLHDHVSALAGSPFIGRMRDEAARLEALWHDIRFTMLVQGGRLVVAPFDDEADLDSAAEAAFGPLGGTALLERPPDRARTGLLGDQLGSVAAFVLDAVAHIEPDLFEALDTFFGGYEDMVDPDLERFARELPFYTRYRRLVSGLAATGVAFALPVVSATDPRIRVHGLVDLALALRLAEEGARPVGNDLELQRDERIMVVSGPNQGGKSTAARALGQLHHLASIGCPVPAVTALVPLTDHVATLFPREERLESLAGGLGEEVERAHALLAGATPRSLLVINEAFASTAADDARVLLTEVLRRIESVGAHAVCVTFLDEVAALGDGIVSLVAEVDTADPAVRTFTLTRRPADGRAYARSLAERYGLTAEAIRARVGGGVR